jgi:hypothetical protein
MVKMRNLIRRLLPGVIFILWLAFPVNAQRQPQLSPPDLFSQTTAEVHSDLRLGPEVIRWRRIEINANVLLDTARVGMDPAEDRRSSFVFNFFDDAVFVAIVESIQPMANGSIGMAGRIEGQALSEFVLVLRGEIVQAYVQEGDRYFEIRYDGSGHVLVEVDSGLYPELLDPEVLAPNELMQLAPDHNADSQLPQADAAGQIDVLAVYTPAARAAVGGTASMETKIQNSILSTNQGYAASGVVQQVRLVGMEEVNYTETVPGVTDAYTTWLYALYRLTFGYYGDGGDPANANYLADARAFRETYGADLVFMVTALPNAYCGLGWLAGHSNQAEIGYSLVHYDCTGNSAYSVQHEMGHNMGACHDRANNSSSGCYDMAYSYGYQQPQEFYPDGFYTVMSYRPSSCPFCTRINRWSNPNLTYNGDPTGVPLGQPDAAYNTLTLNNTAAAVANYRQSVHPISASFVAPYPGGTVMIPRSNLIVAASSPAGDIVRVSYSAYYNASWHSLYTDTNASDGWAYLWPTYNLSEQMINVRAEIEDSVGNVEVIQLDSINLSSSHIIGGIYSSRQGGTNGGEVISVQGPEQDQPGIGTDPPSSAPSQIPYGSPADEVESVRLLMY